MKSLIISKYNNLNYSNIVAKLSQKILSIIVFFFLLSFDSFSQGWVIQSSGTTVSLRDVCFTDANNGTVVGLGKILRTTNGGTTWVQQTSGIIPRLNGVAFSDASNGTVVGAGGTILRTTNSGTTWVQQIIGMITELNDVSFTDANNGTVVGYSGRILRTTNGGTTWASQTSGTTNDLWGVSFTDASNGTAVGMFGTILRTTNSGINWTSQTSGTTEWLYSVSFTDINNGTAVGDYGTILRTTNGGTNWTSQTSGTTEGLYSVSFTDANNGTAVGYAGTILRTTNSGISWTSQSSGITFSLSGVSFTDTNNGTAVGGNGTILKYSTPNITVTSPFEEDIWIVGSEQVVTWSSNNVTGELNIWLSIDGGISYPIPIALITNNDGIETVTVPIAQSSNCRIKIESIDNLSVYGLNPGEFIIREPAPIILVIPTSISFGEVILGDSLAKNLIVKNDGELELNISDVSASNSVFSAIPSSFVVNPGDSQTVVVKFIPADTISYSEELVISNNSGSGSDTISLSGSGIYLSFSLITLSNTSLDFGNVLINSTSQQIFTVYNDVSATINLEVTNITTGNNVYTITPTNFSIASGNSQEVTVKFIPTAGINYNETLIIDHNSTGNQSFISLVGSGFIYPTAITLNKSVTFGPTNNIVNYRIIGLLGEVDIAVIEGLTGEHPYDWNVYWDNGETNNYQIQYNGTSTFNFTPGKSFWILSEQPFTISDQVNSVQIDSIYTNSIPLHNGWNLISNPFERSVIWSDVQTVNGLAQNQILYAWNGSWGNPTTMTPYEGYYFNNSGNLPSLKIPYDPNGSLGKVLAKSQQLINTYEYLKLSLNYNNTNSSEILIGMNENSTNGFDEYDYLAAPGDFESVKISLVNENLSKREKHLFIEQRPEIDEGQVFDVEIKAIPNKKITLFTEGIENFDEYEIYLLEERLGQLYNLKEKSIIDLNPLHKYNNYKLLIGTSEFINDIKEGLVPTDYVLHQNYPNPFNPRTIVRFSLPKKSSVTLNVYSILGELVETLINNQDYEIGNYEVEFEAGRLASGVYLYRIAAGEFVETKKLMLIK